MVLRGGLTPRTSIPQLEDEKSGSLTEDGCSPTLERNGEWVFVKIRNHESPKLFEPAVVARVVGKATNS